jgi:colanic acid/amylovoran biosynthesis protein
VQDRTSPFNLPLHLSRTWVARAGRTPFAGIGLGAGPLTTRPGRQLARRSLARATGVSCRDSGSADLLASLGLARPVVAADPALTLPRPTVEPRDRIVVSLRPWTGQRSLVPVAQRRQRDDPVPTWFLDGAARALDEAAGRTGLAVHFVAFQADRDDVVHRLVAQRMRTAATTAVPDVRTVLDEVAAARVVVGMRYHAGIAATLAGIPSVLVAYAPKVPSLAAELGRGAVGLGWSADGLSRIPDAVASLLDRGDDVAAARSALLTRELRNDVVLDHLLEVAGTR